MLEDEQTVLVIQRARLLSATRPRSPRCAIGDDGDSLLRPQSKTDLDRVAGAGHQFRIDGWK